MYYNKIKSYIFEWHSKLIISMKFLFFHFYKILTLNYNEIQY